jgi:hypothetical protein
LFKNFFFFSKKNKKRLIAIEKKKQQDLSLNIKICFNKDNLGGTEPTQYSQCFVNNIYLFFLFKKVTKK